jgi:hypothetical protein
VSTADEQGRSHATRIITDNGFTFLCEVDEEANFIGVIDLHDCLNARVI